MSLTLREEYCQRHGLFEPTVVYSSLSFVLIRDQFRWKSWRISHLPTEFVFSCRTPISDGYRTGKYFEITREVVPWTDYEEYVLDWAEKIPVDCICRTSEDFFTALSQMFLTVNYGWMQEKEYIVENNQEFLEFLFVLKYKYPEKFNEWECKIATIPFCDDWLKNLISRH